MFEGPHELKGLKQKVFLNSDQSWGPQHCDFFSQILILFCFTQSSSLLNSTLFPALRPLTSFHSFPAHGVGIHQFLRKYYELIRFKYNSILNYFNSSQIHELNFGFLIENGDELLVSLEASSFSFHSVSLSFLGCIFFFSCSTYHSLLLQQFIHLSFPPHKCCNLH